MKYKKQPQQQQQQVIEFHEKKIPLIFIIISELKLFNIFSYINNNDQ